MALYGIARHCMKVRWDNGEDGDTIRWTAIQNVENSIQHCSANLVLNKHLCSLEWVTSEIPWNPAKVFPQKSDKIVFSPNSDSMKMRAWWCSIDMFLCQYLVWLLFVCFCVCVSSLKGVNMYVYSVELLRAALWRKPVAEYSWETAAGAHTGVWIIFFSNTQIQKLDTRCSLRHVNYIYTRLIWNFSEKSSELVHPGTSCQLQLKNQIIYETDSFAVAWCCLSVSHNSWCETDDVGRQQDY